MNHKGNISNDSVENKPSTAWSKANVFELPSNYFHQFPDEMLQNIQLADSIEPSITAAPALGFEIPESYFTTLPNQIMAQVKAMEAIVNNGQYPWDNSARNKTFVVPTTYFEEFPELMLAQVQAANEEVELSSLLTSLKNKTPFSVPEGYLEEPVRPKTDMPKMTVHKAERSIKWSGWAAAAAVIFMFVLGGFKFLSGSSQDSYNAAEQLALISDAEIEAYLVDHIEEINTTMLESKINGAGTLNYQGLLDDVSDEEIEFYLETL